MADRQLKIVVRTEIRKGFADLNRQMQQLSSSIQRLSSLSGSIDKLANAFDKVGTKTNAVASANRSLNKEAAAGVRIANQQAGAAEKLIAKVQSLKRAQTAGALAADKALSTEIKLINDLIKKTGDLSVLEKRRDAKGRFGYGGLSAAAVKAVQTQIATTNAQLSKPITKEVRIKVVNPRGSLQQIIDSKVNSATGSSSNSNLGNFYNDLFNSTKYKNYAKKNLLDEAWPGTPVQGNSIYSRDVNSSSRIRNRMAQMTSGDSANTEYYRNLQAQQDRDAKIAARAARTRPDSFGGGGSRGPGGTFGGLPSGKDVEVSDKLYKNYTKLGHALFLLQQTTLTIFAASGIAQIIQQADAYITLRNQVARTSDSINDLGANMKAVFGIANKTFTDVKAVGNLFSTINKYSTNLGINKEQVAGVTGAISAAYAASPGTADSKSAAQYQLIQAIASNRLGGDELRSQLEQAPVVAEILGKGVAKLRGQEGKTIDLRDKDNPVRTKELISVFGDSETQKNLNKLMADQSRTFSDVLMVAKNRFTEYMGKIQESSGLFTSLNKTMATFIAGDGFDKLMKGLGDAAVGLAVFAATLIATSAMRAGGSAISGVAGQVGAIKNFSNARGAYSAARANAARTSGDLASGLIDVTQAANRGRVAGVAADNLAASKNALAGPLKFIADLFFTVGGAASKFRLIFMAVGATLTVVAIIIGTLAARFNHLLGKFGDGITIFDIMSGIWAKLTRVFEGLMTFMKPVIDGLWKLIDGPLMWLINLAKNDKDIQAAKAAREKAAADEKKGLPTNQKADLPTPKSDNDKKAKQMAERWREMIRDMKVTTSSSLFDAQVDDANIPDNVTGMFESYMANVKKAVDILNIVTKGKSIKEIIDTVTNAKGGEFKNLNVEDFEANLERAFSAQIKSYSKMIADAAYQASSEENTNRPGLLRRQRVRQGNYATATDAFIDTINVDQAKAALATLIGKDKTDVLGDQEVYATLKGRVTAANKTGSNSAGFELLASKLDDQAAARLRDYFTLLETKANKDEESIRSWKDGVMTAVADYYNKITDSASIWGNVIGNALQSLEDTLTNYLTDPSFSEGKSGKEIAKDVGRGILRDVGRAFVQQSIMKPILNMFGLGGSNELGGSINKPMFVKDVDKVTSGIAEKGKNLFSNITDLFKKNEDGSGGFFSNVKNLFSKNADGSGGGIMGAISKLFNNSGGATGGKSGGGFFSSIANMFKKGGSSGGTANGGGWLATAANFVSSFFHEGGVAGAATMSRGVNPGVFRNAKYYHSGGVAGLPGLGSNEVPAILTRGEKIMTLAQQASEKRSGGSTINSPVYSPNIEINYQAGQGSDTSEADAKFMAQQFHEQSQIQFKQFLLKEMKQGGMLAR